ncbi:DUF6384 family protein [Pinisolibacter sp.]|uniref:DUF6384 family protein n=1 Tax=Pinisolibacter sp. TaxID=2172024 RepID=UPI002FDEDAAD
MTDVTATSSTAIPPLAAPPPVPQKLDDLMLAMDVVDTLRHQENLALKELDDDVRKAELVKRLKQIYASQGIEVPDSIVEQGVKALEESRFVYTPAPPSLSRTMATMWVERGRWSKIIGGGLLALVIVGGAFNYFVLGRSAREAEAARIEITQTLPAALTKAKQTALDEAKIADAKARATEVAGVGEAALARKDALAVKAAITDLDELTATLREAYEVRIVSRQGVRSGVFRVPNNKPGVRNHYLVVEAIGPDGRALERSITSEEDQSTSKVTMWGQRVPQATYDQVARDKQDDGIIQNPRLGEKRRGEIAVRWAMPVQTGAITKW